tara:strand:+ start:780 stop:1274 length:495 start_codon:yes stop_codon:yes gene_type:complete
MILLISEEYLKANAIASEAIDYRVYKPHIIACQDLYLDELLGVTFKDALLTGYQNQTLTSYEQQLVVYIKQMLIRRIEAAVTDFLTYRLRSKGVQVSSSGDSSAGTDTQVQYSEKLLNEYADKYYKYACKYLNDFHIEFPLYESDACDKCDEDTNNTNMYFYGF